MKQVQPILADIAREQLLIPTLESRRSDRLDFHNVAVWQVEAALQAAFDTGARSAAQDTERHGNAKGEASLTNPTAPMLIPKGTPLLPGKMYLRLYHGRTYPGQEMDDWGFDGPTFGPLSYYVHTYCSTFRIHAELGTQETWLEKDDDMIRWKDCYYGDMQVFIAGTNDKA
jgi:hypothetical protein